MASRSLRRVALAGLLAATCLGAQAGVAADAGAAPKSSSSSSPAKHAPGQLGGSFKSGKSGSGQHGSQRQNQSSQPGVQTATSSACTTAPQTGSPTTGTPWAQQRLNFRSAWPISDGAGVTVAVIDSGVDDTQPQMSHIHFVSPHNVVTGTSDVTDCAGHGTGVAGIIAAPPLNGTFFVGVAPGAKIMPIRQTDAEGHGSTDGYAEGIRYAVDHGAKVVNISGGSTVPATKVEQAIRYAQARNVMIVASAGNDAETSGVASKEYPAAYAPKYDNVIAVSAVDRNDQVANFSELGGYTTLCAPGVDIVMPSVRSGYHPDKGTSFAAPFVAGTIALMLGADRRLTPEDIKARLIASVDAPPKTVPDPKYGYGIVNPYRAVTAITTPAPSATPTKAAPLSPVAAPAPPDRGLQHAALGAAAAMVVLAVFLLGGWALARRRRTALRGIHTAPLPDLPELG